MRPPDLPIANTTAGFFIDLIEADLLALAGRREKLNRARNERQAQVALPIRADGHDILQYLNSPNLAN